MGDLTRTLARVRVPLGFAFGVMVLWLAAPTRLSIAWGAGVATVGEALRIWAAGHLNKSREVTSSGPYRWFAHPLYVGSSVMGMGLAIASASVLVGLLIALYLVTTVGAAIRSEESFLRGKFGADYDAYRRGSNRIEREAEQARRFSVAQALRNREHRTLAGVVLALLLLLLKASL